MTPEDEATWRRALLRFRAEKDEFMAGPESPFLRGAVVAFTALSYFDPDPALRFVLKLHRYADMESVIMATSQGTRRLYNKAGRFEFAVDGKPCTLQAYQPADQDSSTLFVPFRDATSGKESYGAARYIDMEVEHDDQYALDFNYAYNPYCAYSDAWTCPLPPRENWLAVPVRAGERKYHD